MIDVPSGTVTATPSISSVTGCRRRRRAACRNRRGLGEYMRSGASGSPRGNVLARSARDRASMPPRPHSEPSNMVSHSSSSSARLASRSTPCTIAVDHLDAARRADAAGRALAARLEGAELHRVARHLRPCRRCRRRRRCPPCPTQRADLGERLVVERRVELRFGQVGAERSADLHRANRPARGAAAAVVVEQLAQRQRRTPSRSARRA